MTTTSIDTASPGVPTTTRLTPGWIVALLAAFGLAQAAQGYGGFIGAAAYLGSAAVAARTPWPWPPRTRRLIVGLPLFMFVMAATLSVPFGPAARGGPTYDATLYALDYALLGAHTFALGRLYASQPLLRVAGEVVYLGLPLILAAAWVVAERRGRNTPDLLVAAGVAGALGFVCYQLVPATGPAFYGPAVFPLLTSASLSGYTVHPQAARNAMPSLHMTWTLLATVWIWPLGRRARAFAVVTVCLMAAATMGRGDHYAVDLLAAAPFTALVVALTRAGYARFPRTLQSCIRP